MSSQRQRGLAVVMALLVVALASALAGDLMWRQHLWLRQMQNEADHAQGKAVAQAGVHWARSILADDERTSNADHNREPWATRLPATTVENGEISGYILDQQGQFNLNNLLREDGSLSEKDLARFRRLLELLALPASLGDKLAEHLREPPGGKPREFATLGDLRNVEAIAPEALDRLKGYVTVLPGRTRVNVNTASAEVLAAMAGGLSLSEARVLAAGRDRAWFRDLADFRARLARTDLEIVEEDLSVQTRFFAVVSEARIGRAKVAMEALLARGNGRWPTLVWERLR